MVSSSPWKHRNNARKPFQALKTNPFTNRENNNFPGLDNAFDSKKTSPDRQSGISSELNTSIGARAYSSQFRFEQTPPKKILNHSPGDCEWDHLLDGSNISFSSTYVTELEANTIPPFQSFALYSRQKNNTSTLDENEPLNMTSDRSDFFNSSRVGILKTPEKNKPIVDEASRLARLGVGVMNKRGEINSSSNYSESISGSTDISFKNSNDPSIIGLFDAAIKLNDKEQQDGMICDNENNQGSFITYQDPDLSLLSVRDSQPYSKPSGGKRMNFREDTQSSFISFAEPDLSILSNKHSNFGGTTPHYNVKGDESTSAARREGKNSPNFGNFDKESEDGFFDIKKYPTSNLSPKSDFPNSDFGADMSEIRVPSNFDQRTPEGSPNSASTRALDLCILPATPKVDYDAAINDGFKDFDQNTRFVSTTSRSETMNSYNNFLKDKRLSIACSPQRINYNNITEDKTTAEIVSTEKVTPRSSPTIAKGGPRTPSTSKLIFSGLSPISNLVRGYSSDDDDENESPISDLNKSLFCTTLTEIQSDSRIETRSSAMLRSHLETTSLSTAKNYNCESSNIFRKDSETASSSTQDHHVDEITVSSEMKNGNLQQEQNALPRRSRLAERYSRPDRFEDSFAAESIIKSGSYRYATRS